MTATLLLHESTDSPDDPIRQHIGDPDQPTVFLALSKDRIDALWCVASPDRSVVKPASFIVNINDQLAHDHVVRKGHDSGVSLKANVDNGSRREAPCTAPTSRTADLLRAGLDQDYFVNRRHCIVFLITLLLNLLTNICLIFGPVNDVEWIYPR